MSDQFEASLKKLRDITRRTGPADMRQAFDADPERAGRFSAMHGDMLLDYAKCAVSDEIMAALFELARASGLEARREAMFAGEHINITENRAVLHTALRAPRDMPIHTDGEPVSGDVAEVLDRMAAFADMVRSGYTSGISGKRFTDVVNIGIGGSDLGPAMATLALEPYHDGPRLHFVSNVDGADIADVLRKLDPATTLFVVASKTFTTIETMTNAETARRWLSGRLGEAAVGVHFAAVSTALDKVRKFGIDEERTFGFWDWVGGRYSIWSAIGLPLMIAIGRDAFRAFLDGGHAMDRHFETTPLHENLPVLLGLVGYWHREVMDYPTRAIVPYDQRLARFPAYLQQLDMESNGKRVGLDGKPLTHRSGPVVWGEPGTNGQHAFFQLIHQGTDIIPVEFLVAARGHEPDLDHQHRLLIANCLAQSEALMRGRTELEAAAQLAEQGMARKDAARLIPHKTFPGNRPSITILYDKLTPAKLGELIALYEHRVFVEACLYGINAFDQWGVELGKELATALLPVVEQRSSSARHDSSTRNLLAQIFTLREKPEKR
ncbi:MAG: glucose-6-phosphate isomerase [Rhizobiaceae bacterium]